MVVFDRRTRTYGRRFEWQRFPNGFFPRLLVRLMHQQLSLHASWIDAAVLCGGTGDEVAFLQLSKPGDAFDGVISDTDLDCARQRNAQYVLNVSCFVDDF